MSSPQDGFSPSAAEAAAGNPNAGKKAVHVKWAGKTIALGTFPSSDADEKCARAKALTRAWRSTMRPKPSRDWVMLELERLGVRVVSGRLGRKAGEEDDGEPQKPVDMRPGGGPPVVDRKNSMAWSTNADLDQLMQRRNSSLGLSMLNDDLNRRSSLSSLGPVLGLDGGSMGGDSIPPHRPLVGGGAAAAYEAARADHYAQKREEQQRRASSLGLGGIGGGGNMPQMGLSVNPNQHYEMLKLHHMNLLNEIQETTLMMNLYQQQQLQQQQQQLQQQQASEGANDQMAMLLQQQGGGIDGMFGPGSMGHRGSLGMGAVSTSDITMARQQQLLHQSGALGGGAPAAAAPAVPPKKAGRPPKKDSGISAADAKVKEEILKGQDEQKALEEKLKKLKDDIAKRQKEAEDLEKIANQSKVVERSSSEKRKADESEKTESKKLKVKEEDTKDDDDKT